MGCKYFLFHSNNSHRYLTAIQVVTFIWGFLATIIITLLPLYEGWPTLVLFIKFLMGKKITHPKPESIDGEHVIVSGSPASGSQVGDEKIINESKV